MGEKLKMRHKRAIITDESYRPNDLVGKTCVDFLPNINPNSSLELDILKRWQHHFELQGVPYYVVRLGPDRWALYKEQRCVYK